MSNLFWLTDAQMERVKPFFPKSHGKPRVDDSHVLSGKIFLNRNGLRWCDAPEEYVPHKTLYNRWKRWSEMRVFARIMAGLASEGTETKIVMICSTSCRRRAGMPGTIPEQALSARQSPLHHVGLE